MADLNKTPETLSCNKIDSIAFKLRFPALEDTNYTLVFIVIFSLSESAKLAVCVALLRK